MNKFHIAIYILLLFASSCAKQSSPMGGPKDEVPPILLSTDPENYSTNINLNEINLTFDEFVALDNPTKMIIITPKLKTEEIQFLANKNRINIKLNQELEDSTTYVFNFQKSIQDVTEKNPAENVKLVFSTGYYIDSLSITGKVAYTEPRKEREFKDILVGLYPENDTTDLFIASPYYIAQADTAGNFEITNIKAGRFRLYAWHDENNSLKAEYRTEQYGFFPEPIDIQENINNFHINIFRGDISNLNVNRSSAAGTNYDVVLSKPPITYEINHPDVGKSLFYRLNDRTIRLYHTSLVNDSIEVRLSVRDSVGFAIDTTLFAKFEESDRRLEDLTLTANSGISFVKNLQSKITFNKPIQTINLDSVFVKYDTAGRIPIRAEHIFLDDSTKRTSAQIRIAIPDSLVFETYQIYIGDSAVIDVEGIPNKDKLEANYKKLKEDRLADGITGKVITDERPILVQLLNKRDEIVADEYLEDGNNYKFERIEAGDYKVRAIIDRNRNRRWDPGNFRLNIQPEPIYYFVDAETNSQEMMLRAGWTLTDIDLTPRRDTGYYPDNVETTLKDDKPEEAEEDPEDVNGNQTNGDL